MASKGMGRFCLIRPSIKIFQDRKILGVSGSCYVVHKHSRHCYSVVVAK